MNPATTTTDTRPFSPKIDRNYPKPKLKLPPGASACHFHFIGPQKQFTLKPNHVFSHLQFEDTPIEAANNGKPLMKFAVPSIGSTAQTYSAYGRSPGRSLISSPMWSWLGNRSAIRARSSTSTR